MGIKVRKSYSDENIISSCWYKNRLQILNNLLNV